MATDLPLVYTQNARPAGFPLTLRLSGGRLVLDSTRRVEEITLSEAEAVRLTYEPRSVAQRAFKTSVILKDGRTVRFTSVSWRGLTRAEEQGAEYRAFLLGLVAAVARHNPGVRLLAGKPAPVWYGIVALAALAAVGTALFIGRAFLAGEPGAGLFGILVAAGGIWQVAPFVRRNRPRSFGPDAVPADLLP